MIDIHSHILPGMDDGSRDEAESLAMLENLAAQEVSAVIATPHFYAEENSPAEFLRRRAEAEERLNAVWHSGLPEVRLGAEVCCFEGMSHTEDLEKLCIEDTKILLLEMPFQTWSSRLVQEVVKLRRDRGLTIVLAHIERYLPEQGEDLEYLQSVGILTQCNASFFLRWRTRRKALRMLDQGKIQFLGSDCHNMTSRPPRLGEALAAIGGARQQILEGTIRKYFVAGEDA